MVTELPYNIYGWAKEAGYAAHDEIERIFKLDLARLRANLDRPLSEAEMDEFTEGWWNGVV
jgi:hypothetical protein